MLRKCTYHAQPVTTLYIYIQARNQTFLEGGSKFGMVAQMKWAL